MHDVREVLQMLVELHILCGHAQNMNVFLDQIFPCELQGELRSRVAKASIVLRRLLVYLLVTKVWMPFLT